MLVEQVPATSSSTIVTSVLFGIDAGISGRTYVREGREALATLLVPDCSLNLKLWLKKGEDRNTGVY
jgi:hypothetical protein